MKAVLISIKPEWCLKIANGEKTVEIRKSFPSEKNIGGLPFKCYIYCTKSAGKFAIPNAEGKPVESAGKIIGEFTCDSFGSYSGLVVWDKEERYIEESCVPIDRIDEYRNGGEAYLWHISNLRIYHKPVELNDFWGIKPCKKPYECCVCEKFDIEKMDCNEKLSIARPPQSWCYVDIGD